MISRAALGVVIAVWLLFSLPYITGGRIPFPSTYLVSFFPPWSAYHGLPVKNNAMPDVITQIYPWKKVTIDSWKIGQVPLWNPYSFSGTSHAGNYQTAVFSPVNLLFFMFPMIDAWSIAVLLQPILAGLFTYILMRQMRASGVASAVSAVSFMFCGFVVTWMAYETLVWAALWIPLIFVGLLKLHERMSWGWGSLVSISMALSFVSGHFQISLYVLLASTLFAAYLSARGGGVQYAIRSGLFLVLGFLLAAPQVLISYDVFGESVRQQLVQRSGIDWKYLPTIIAPDFYGNPVTRNDWFGQYAEWAGFFGSASFVLAVIGLWTKKSSTHRWFFASLWVLALAFAYPTVFNGLIYTLKIPSLSTSNATRIIVLFSFSGSILAGLGLDGLKTAWTKQTLRSFWLPAAITISVITALWIVAFVAPYIPAEHIAVARRNVVLPTVLSLAVLTVGAAGWFITPKYRTVALVILLGIVSFDGYRYASKWMPFDPREHVYPQMDVISYLQEHDGHGRIFGNTGNELNSYFGLSSIEGYDAVYNGRYAHLMSSVENGRIGTPSGSVVQLPKHGEYSERMMQLLGVEYLLQRNSDGRSPWAYPYWLHDHYRTVYKDEQYEVLRNDRAIQRAYLVSDYRVRTRDQDIVDELYSETFVPGETVVLETDPDPDPEEGTGSASIETYTPNVVTIRTDTTVPKILVLTDVWNDGWHATVDGLPVPVHRANFAFRAVSVPAGQHVIRFEYMPDSAISGFALAVFAAGVLAFGSIYERYGRRTV